MFLAHTAQAAAQVEKPSGKAGPMLWAWVPNGHWYDLAPPSAGAPDMVCPTITDSLTMLRHVPCIGGATGEFQFVGKGGVAPYTYTLSTLTGNVTNSTGYFNNLVPKDYRITVTDANGCTGTRVRTLEGPTDFTLFNNAGSNLDWTVDSISTTGGFSYNYIPNASAVIALKPNGDSLSRFNQGNLNAMSRFIQIGFPFKFDNFYYDSLVIAEDGVISFNRTLNPSDLLNQWHQNAFYRGSGTYAAPVTGECQCDTAYLNRPLPFIAPFRDDMQTNNTGSVASKIVYMLSGMAPNRIFTIEWRNMRWNRVCNTQRDNSVSIQLELYEGSNKIRFHYKPEPQLKLNNCGDIPNTQGYDYSIGLFGRRLGPGNYLSINPDSSVLYSNGKVKTTNQTFPSALGYSRGKHFELTPPNPNPVVCEPPLSIVSATATSTCSNTGVITITATGGLFPGNNADRRYFFSKNGGKTYKRGNTPANGTIYQDTFRNLTPGTYRIAIRDSIQQSFVIQTIVVPSLTATASIAQPISCNGGSDGQIRVSWRRSSPSGMYNLRFQNGATIIDYPNLTDSTRLFTGLNAGTYNFTVTYQDYGGCTTTATQMLTAPTNVTFVSAPTTIPTCFGGNNGQMVMTVLGGTTPYMYSVDNGANYQSSNQFTNLTSGSYTIKAKDVNNCPSVTTPTVSVGSPLAVIILLVSKQNASCANPLGMITITASGGTGTYVYSKDGGTSYQTSNVFSNLPVGTYQLRVKDSNECASPVSSFSIAGPVNCCPAAGTIWYVDGAAASGGTGTSWTCAFQNVQDAIDAASSGHEIWVKAGTYKPTKDPLGSASPTDARDKTFYLKNGVKMYGGFAGGETLLSQRNATTNVTTLSGDLGAAGDAADNCYHVVLSVGDGTGTELDGFTVSGGNANGSGSIFAESTNVSRAAGGGMLNVSTSIILGHCIFTANASFSRGGGLSNINVVACSINDCAFVGNVSSGIGGGISNDNSSPQLSNCVISGNDCSSNGGGIANYSGSNATLTNCLISGNRSLQYGGGVRNEASNSSFINCTISGNRSINLPGGGMLNGGSNPILQNCIVWNNRDNTGSGTASSAIFGFTSTPVIGHSLIQNQNPAGTGNLNGTSNAANSNYPDFTTPLDPSTAPSMAGDFHLTACSPVLNLGDNTGAPATDLFGNTRIFGGTIDLGVHELQAAATPVVALCKNTTVQLNGSGNATLTASALDNSSTGCAPLAFSAAPNTFTCANLGPNAVTLTVTGANGATATCSATVTVADQVAPNALCRDIVKNLGTNGMATVTVAEINNLSNDNCGAVNLVGVTPSSFTCANIGMNTVTLTVNDGRGNTSTCNATVTIADNTAPTITCPANQTVTGNTNCQGTLGSYAALATKSDNCSAPGNISVTQTPASGQLFTGSQTVVLTASDFSENTATCSFIVSVVDNTPPTINCPANQTVSANATCQGTLGSYAALATKSDNCTAPNSIGVMQSPASGTPIAGTTTVTLIATDAANNSATCAFSVSVRDVTPPTVTCPGNQTVLATTNVPCVAVVNGLGATYSDLCSSVSVAYALSGAGTGNGSGQASGLTFQAGSTTVTYTATDGAGNSGTCALTVYVNPCQVTFTGTITWKQDNTSGVKDATVAVTGDRTGSATTAANGTYSLTLDPGANFVLTPSKNLNKLNGVNALDVQRIQQHLNGGLITNLWQLIAADVNSNNVISALDANILQLALLGNTGALAQMTKSWRFVPKTHVMASPPWGFPENIVLASAAGTVSNLDFWGLKAGDVVATYANPANSTGTPLVLTAQDQALVAGQTLTVDVTASTLRDLSALQFALRFDPKYLQLDDIQPLTGLPLTKDNFGTYQASEGSLRVLWSDAQSAVLRAGAPLFRLRFVVLEDGMALSGVLGMDDATLLGQVFKGDGAASGVSLRFEGTTAVHAPSLGRAQLLQNLPNPFVHQTTIGFVLPEACEAQLRIVDVGGRVVVERSKQYPAGRNEERFDLQTAPGVLYYELTTPWGVLARKMVVVE